MDRAAAQRSSETTIIEGLDSNAVHGLSPDKFQQLVSLTLIDLKENLVLSAADQLSRSGFGTRTKIEFDLRRALNKLRTADVIEFLRKANAPVEGWGYRERDPVSREIFRAVIPNMIAPGSSIEGLENLTPIASQPLIFLGNHLAALDVHLLDTVLTQNGFREVADKLVAIVGHKTFLFPLLREMSLTFGTLQVPQSMSVSPRSKELGAREIAKGAAAVIQAANERLALGESLVVFPEGTRSRSGALYEMLPGVSKYLRSIPGYLVPWAHWGIEQALPPDTFDVMPAVIHVRFGKPVCIDQLKFKGEKRGENMMDAVGYLIADLLPEERRGAYSLKGSLKNIEAAEKAEQILKSGQDGLNL